MDYCSYLVITQEFAQGAEKSSVSRTDNRCSIWTLPHRPAGPGAERSQCRGGAV